MESLDLSQLTEPVRTALEPLFKQVDEHLKSIAKHRDGLRDVVSQIEGLIEEFDEALDDFQFGIEKLSRSV